MVNSTETLPSASSSPPPVAASFGIFSDAGERCRNATGYDFLVGQPPNRTQMRYMCADSDCIVEANYYLLNAHLNPFPPESYYQGLAAFVYPLMDFCYYYHEPGEPCPTDFLGTFLRNMKELVDACEAKSGFSFQRDLPPNKSYVGGENRDKLLGLCKSKDCENLLKRLYVKPIVRTCQPFPTMEDRDPAPYAQLRDEFVMPYVDVCDVGSTETWYIPFFYHTTKNFVRLPGPLPGDPVRNKSEPSPSSYDGSGSAAVDEVEGEDDTISFPPVQWPPPPPVEWVANWEQRKEALPPGTTEIPVLWSHSEGSSGNETMVIAVGDGTLLPRPPSTTTGRSHEPSTSDATTPVAQTEASSKEKVLLWGVTVSVLALLVLLLLFVWYRHRIRRTKLSKTSDVYQSLDSRSSTTTRSTGDLSSMHGLLVACKEIPANDLVEIGIIGGGGSGVVFLVQDTSDEHLRLLASKRLHRDQHSTKQADAFLAEINLAAQLSHPRVVEFIGVAGLHKTELQALFEYMPGGDLRKFLDLQTPNNIEWTPQKLQIAVDVADALTYLHTLEPTAVVHRDLKSRNIMLTRDLRAKVCDFGVARSQSADASMTTGVGTSRWLAPEVITGGGDYDVACDVYAFGVVLTELDTHRVPFSDLVYPNGDQLTDFAVLEMIVTQQKRPSLSESCPASIARLANRCLSFEPTKRPKATEVAIALRSVQRELGWDSRELQ